MALSGRVPGICGYYFETSSKPLEWRQSAVIRSRTGFSTPRRFPYTFVQDLSLVNAQGLVKFMLPNKYDVYLHDTRHRHKIDYRRDTGRSL